jgi:hypothetical protein
MRTILPYAVLILATVWTLFVLTLLYRRVAQPAVRARVTPLRTPALRTEKRILRAEEAR